MPITISTATRCGMLAFGILMYWKQYRLRLRVTQRYVKFVLPTFDIRAKYGRVLGFSPRVLSHYRRRYFLPEFYAELSGVLL